MAEYESRPFEETQWMLHIDEIYHEAKNELEEAAARRART